MERKGICFARQRGDLGFWVKELVGAIYLFSTYFSYYTCCCYSGRAGTQLIFIKASQSPSYKRRSDEIHLQPASTEPSVSKLM